jgi:hypothetical protein
LCGNGGSAGTFFSIHLSNQTQTLGVNLLLHLFIACTIKVYGTIYDRIERFGIDTQGMIAHRHGA